MTSPSIYCLHLEDWDHLDERIGALHSAVDYVAVGMDLHMEHPRESLERIRCRGLRAYAHFLYYDIEEVVVQAARGLVDLGYDAFDVHAFCGAATISRTCAVAGEQAEQAGRVAPVVIGCALLPSQLDLPWRADQNSGDPEELTSRLAEGAVSAGADGVLVPHQVADRVAAVVPSDKLLIAYANPSQTSLPVQGRGQFYDWHLDTLWATPEGIGLVQSRRP